VIRVLIADDHALARGGLRGMLAADPEIVGEAADGAEAVAQTRRERPDVVVMDVRMPRMDGIEATRRIQQQPEPPRVLVLTTFDLDEYVYEALRAGASGFMLKDAPPSQLLEAVRSVARGDTLLAPAVTRRLVERFVERPTPGPDEQRRLEQLTDRELEVLKLIATGRSNAEIAADLFLSEATVKTHFTRIASKLELRDRVQAVVFAYENGLVEPGKPA